jgi:hypothetical protein
LINRTAHAAALSALVETATTYRFYFGVYVRSVSRFTPFYMALIDPFRKLIVYPSLLRSVRVRWNQAFGTSWRIVRTILILSSTPVVFDTWFIERRSAAMSGAHCFFAETMVWLRQWQ